MGPLGQPDRPDRADPLWRDAEALAVRFGLTAIPYEQRDGRYSRIHQFALVHVFHPSTDVYTCPLAMTDGAARTSSTPATPRWSSGPCPG